MEKLNALRKQKIRAVILLEAVVALAIFASLFVRSKASIRVTDMSRKAELRQLLGAEDSLLSPSALVKRQGHFAGHQLFESGAITIQDESSQLVAPTLDIEGEEEILDACSAPGGKTVHMASYLTNGHITALDLYDCLLYTSPSPRDRG